MWKLLFFLASIMHRVCRTYSVNQLSFSGGGAFGAVEIGIAKRLYELEPYKKYDIYTGISAGGLNAGYLSFYADRKEGLAKIYELYDTLTTRHVYEVLPTTGNSVFNTKPLHETLTNIVSKMPNKPVVYTLIGATNLNTGRLDIYNFTEMGSIEEYTALLMATSAIPVMFPPVLLRGNYYADGGVLSNELLNVQKYNDYLNITYITPFSEHSKYEGSLDTIIKVASRTFTIVKNNFDNPLDILNQECVTPIGEVNVHYVDSALLSNYNMMKFDNGKELLDIGYNNMQSIKYKLC